MSLTTIHVQSIAFVLFLLALPLASFGAMEGNELIWGASLALLVVAGILPAASRFLDLDDGDEDDGDDGDQGEADQGEADPDADDGDADRDGDDGEAEHAARNAGARPRRSDREPRSLAPEHPRATERPPAAEDERPVRARERDQAARAREASEGDDR
jgi:hypothetical protein